MVAPALKQMVRHIPGASVLYHNARALTCLLRECWFVDRRRMNDRSIATREWDFETPSARERHERVLAALALSSGTQSWQQVLEIGCADGVFTRLLAERCGSVTAVDISEVGRERTQERCAGRANVRVAALDLQRDPLPGEFDVVFAMDVLEFIHGRSRVADTARRLAAGIRPRGFLAISMSRLPDEMRGRLWARWLIEGGDNMSDFLDGRHGLRLLQRQCYPRYLIALYQKTA